jgi:ketosteroid isomerase-like protein
MISWLAKQLLSYNMRRLNAGDPEPTLRLEADDVTFRFPGESSWAGEYHGKDEVRAWLQRFTRVGLQIFTDEVAVKGFPWNQTVCLRGHDYLRSPAGELVYANRFVIWGRLTWGRLREYEVYEDTEKTAALDLYLTEHEREYGSFPLAVGRNGANTS